MYFSYFVVHKDSPVQQVSDLNQSHRFGINGRDSLSGCHSIRFWLHQTKRDHTKYKFFQTGGHAKTLDHIVDGKLDCGAIDVVCLLRARMYNPELWSKLRVLSDTVLGPYPAQPITVSRDETQEAELIRGFEHIDENTNAKAFVKRFTKVSNDLYDGLRKLFRDTEHIQLG